MNEVKLGLFAFLLNLSERPSVSSLENDSIRTRLFHSQKSTSRTHTLVHIRFERDEIVKTNKVWFALWPTFTSTTHTHTHPRIHEKFSQQNVQNQHRNFFKMIFVWRRSGMAKVLIVPKVNLMTSRNYFPLKRPDWEIRFQIIPPAVQQIVVYQKNRWL